MFKYDPNFFLQHQYFHSIKNFRVEVESTVISFYKRIINFNLQFSPPEKISKNFPKTKLLTTSIIQGDNFFDENIFFHNLPTHTNTFEGKNFEKKFH